MSVNGTTKRGWWVATLSTAMLLASGAGADDGPYVAADVGLAIASESDVRTRVDPGQLPPYDQLRGTLQYSPGWMIDGALGWRISDYRVELNASYSDNQNDRLEFGPAGAPVPGGLQIVGAMVRRGLRCHHTTESPSQRPHDRWCETILYGKHIAPFTLI